MTQEEKLEEILKKNLSIQAILERAPKLNMPNWYLGAGGIAQTVWNVAHGFDAEKGIRDYDLVYYDPQDISYEGEDAFIQRGQELFKDTVVPIEIRNQARVHLWYEKHFGYSIPQHPSAEDAINTWPTTATAVGVRREGDQLKIYTPFGLDDLMGMIVRANKTKITKEIYEDKVNRWSKIWPNLTILSWENS